MWHSCRRAPALQDAWGITCKHNMTFVWCSVWLCQVRSYDMLLQTHLALSLDPSSGHGRPALWEHTGHAECAGREVRVEYA